LTPLARATARDRTIRGEADALANRREWTSRTRSPEAVVNNPCSQTPAELSRRARREVNKSQGTIRRVQAYGHSLSKSARIPLSLTLGNLPLSLSLPPGPVPGHFPARGFFSFFVGFRHRNAAGPSLKRITTPCFIERCNTSRLSSECVKESVRITSFSVQLGPAFGRHL
jgi:hypothetical protein